MPQYPNLPVSEALLTEAEASAAYEAWHAFASATSPVSQSTNWNSRLVVTSMYFNQRLISTGAQNAVVGWDLLLSAGTWDFVLTHRVDTNNGIYTVNIGGSDVGTIDGYAAAGAVARDTLTGVTVASTGKQRVKLTMATKNASSGSYFGQMSALEMQRTA